MNEAERKQYEAHMDNSFKTIVDVLVALCKGDKELRVIRVYEYSAKTTTTTTYKIVDVK